MNDQFKYLILNYLDKTYRVKDNILISDQTLKRVIVEMSAIFGLTLFEALALFKVWITPKLTTDDKTFYRKLTDSSGKYNKYKFTYLNGKITYSFALVFDLNETPHYIDFALYSY